MSNAIEGILGVSMEKIREMVDVNTIVGDAITSPDGTTIIPVSKVSFGFASGGSDLPTQAAEKFAGGAGAGVTVKPVAFIVISRDGDVKLMELGSKPSAVDGIVDAIPGLIEKIKGFVGDKRKKDKEEKKAKTGKKRVKVAGPETADAAHDWTPLPCEALLEHLLPGSPELEATRRHGQHVAHLAEQLFDQLQPLHGLDGRWLYRLRIACCLHDIGFASGRKGHHKKGMRIVEQDTSLALLPEDRSLVAQLVRYHRKAWPAMRHRRFAALGKKDREALNKAAALIRMADALDYRHMEAVRDVAIDLQPGKVVLTLSGAQDCAPEQDRLLVKGDLFMHIFGVELECVCPIL